MRFKSLFNNSLTRFFSVCSFMVMSPFPVSLLAQNEGMLEFFKSL